MSHLTIILETYNDQFCVDSIILEKNKTTNGVLLYIVVFNILIYRFFKNWNQFNELKNYPKGSNGLLTITPTPLNDNVYYVFFGVFWKIVENLQT